MRILLVEDELELLKSIAENLKMAGYVVDTADNGKDAENMVFVEEYDLVVLDVNLPKMDGFTVLEHIRRENKILSIILLTARSSITDRVRGLDLGANDYMVKPFYPEELEARIRSLLRRKTIQQDARIYCAGITFDTASRIASVEGESLKLTKKETQILEYLMFNQGRRVSQEEILEHAWDDGLDVFSNTVRVHMSALRKKLKNRLGRTVISNTIGEGYMIDEN